MTNKERELLKGSFGVTPIINQSITSPEAAISKYSPMLNGTGINQLQRTITSRQGTITAEITFDEIQKRLEIKQNNAKITVEEIDERGRLSKVKGGSELTPSTNALLDMLMLKLTQQVNYKGKVDPAQTFITIPLKEYVRSIGKDETDKSVLDFYRRNVKKDLDTLRGVSIEWNEKGGKGNGDYLSIGLCSSHGFHNGNIIFTFTLEMAQYLANAYITQYPLAILTLDGRNPVASLLARKLSQHAQIDSNVKRGSNKILKVKTLLDHCEHVIPAYEEVVKSNNRHVSKKIIEPLVNGLNTLQDANIIKWHFCNSKAAVLTDEQTAEVESNYDVFKDSYVYFEMVGAPERVIKPKRRSASRSRSNKTQKLN